MRYFIVPQNLAYHSTFRTAILTDDYSAAELDRNVLRDNLLESIKQSNSSLWKDYAYAYELKDELDTTKYLKIKL